MLELKMEHLEHTFNMAKKSGERFVAIVVEMEGFEDSEVIINPLENVDAKLDYYKKTYGSDLTHKFSKGIRIIGMTYGNSYEEIYNNLFGE
jgi:hypothetical protein